MIKNYLAYGLNISAAGVGRGDYFLPSAGQLVMTVRPVGVASTTRALTRNRDPSGDGENCVRVVSGLTRGPSNRAKAGAKVRPASPAATPDAISPRSGAR